MEVSGKIDLEMVNIDFCESNMNKKRVIAGKCCEIMNRKVMHNTAPGLRINDGDDDLFYVDCAGNISK